MSQMRLGGNFFRDTEGGCMWRQRRPLKFHIITPTFWRNSKYTSNIGRNQVNRSTTDSRCEESSSLFPLIWNWVTTFLRESPWRKMEDHPWTSNLVNRTAISGTPKSSDNPFCKNKLLMEVNDSIKLRGRHRRIGLRQIIIIRIRQRTIRGNRGSNLLPFGFRERWFGWF